QGALGEAGVGRPRAWVGEEAQEAAEAGLSPAGTRHWARFLGSASEGSGQRRRAALATAASARSGRSPHGPQRVAATAKPDPTPPPGPQGPNSRPRTWPELLALPSPPSHLEPDFVFIVL
ncbi:unnamed protein product, partial [Gulo gulo]